MLSSIEGEAGGHGEPSSLPPSERQEPRPRDAATVTRTDDTAADFNRGTPNGTVVARERTRRRGRDSPGRSRSVRRAGPGCRPGWTSTPWTRRAAPSDATATGTLPSTARAPTAAVGRRPGQLGRVRRRPRRGSQSARRLRRRLQRPALGDLQHRLRDRWHRAVRRACPTAGRPLRWTVNACRRRVTGCATRYRIDWTATGFAFYVDGTLRREPGQSSLTGPMHVRPASRLRTPSAAAVGRDRHRIALNTRDRPARSPRALSTPALTP